MENEDQGRVFVAVIARAMSDEAFRLALVADAAAVLTAEGVEVPEVMSVNVLQSSATQAFIVLPDPNTANDELLAASAGGSTVGTGGTAGTFACSTAPACAFSVGTAGSAG